MPGLGRSVQKLRDASPAEGRLKAVIALFRNSLLKQRLSDLPRIAVGESRRDIRMQNTDFEGDAVGVEKNGTLGAEYLLTEARFSRPVDPG